jgi:hypothetical protein
MFPGQLFLLFSSFPLLQLQASTISFGMKVEETGWLKAGGPLALVDAS